MAGPLTSVRLAAMLAGLALAGGALAQEADTPPADNRIEASQIAFPAATNAPAGPGRAYLDSAGRPAAPMPAAERIAPSPAPGFTPAESAAPASQISAIGDGAPGMAQLSRADLDATLAQLSPGERRVLFEAIAGSDICDNPPQIAAIIALCRTRLETRSREFETEADALLSAEDRLLRGDLETSTLPSVAQVVERLARGGASSGDFSNQAIASIALGTNPPSASRREEQDPGEQPKLGEQAQALINALINQLGGRAP